MMFCWIPFFSYLALKTIPMSTVYMSTAITQVIILMLSRFVLDEKIPYNSYIGIVFILMGIFIFTI